MIPQSPTAADLGVNVHSSYPAYSARLPALAAKVNEAGFGWLRDNNPDGPRLWRAAGYTGRVLVVANTLDAARRAIDAGADCIDPVNEIDPTSTAQKQVALDIQAECARLGVPCLAPSLASINGTKADALGYQPLAVRPNVHCYRGMQDETAWRARQREFSRQAGKAAPGRAGVVGETGTHSYLVPGKPATYKGPENANHRMTPDSVAAQQIVGDVLAFFELGAETVFLYELVDQAAYRTPDGHADHEGYFGLLTEALDWKQHGQVLVDWMATLPSPARSAARLDAQLGAAALQVQQARDAVAAWGTVVQR